jgi:hypothetical protein
MKLPRLCSIHSNIVGQSYDTGICSYNLVDFLKCQKETFSKFADFGPKISIRLYRIKSKVEEK